ncbi:MAG TPA: tRNA (N(6)-L-threonylcarbamoyladenosine(37)-C(2))-methylthiotransferase MtaB [Candidatus Acidoferrales bacterium]|nr:tRNA (N(6)-L-threonylcarbamoyladenosine(37)-C(2))-methylthiotransferase MtaB [Candidatus Acidoferrales bacterium]
MATFSIENFGCRATEADASALRRSLLDSGLTLAAEHDSADFVVLNTCTVTAAADSQAREAIRKIHRANPAARIVVTGCYAQRAPEELAVIEGIAWVVGNSHQADIPNLVRAIRDAPNAISAADFVPVERLENDSMSLAHGPAKILTGDIFAQMAVAIAPATFMVGEDGHTRPIFKIQDGCNNRCSYCVIPFVRGRSRSLPPDEVVREVRSLVSAGAKEIVLSGINLGSYGRDLTPRLGLAEVVRRILDETAVQRLRFSSIEPQDVTEDFIALVASSERITPHFHVPLQSGSDHILRAMHRWYRTGHYAERISLVRRLLPDAAIGADVIVGFPGETDGDFRATAEFITQLPFTYLHVFSFSARPGTKAADFGDEVPTQTIRERARALRAISEKKSKAFRASQAGRNLRALTLARSGEDWTEALTGNYLKVRIAGRHPANEWHDVEIQI